MRARNEGVVQLVAAVLLFGLFAWIAGAWQRADDADRWENRVVHLEAKCQQRPDGSAVCEPGAFDPVTTTTVAP